MKLSKEFKHRRKQLMDLVDSDSIIILPAALEKTRNNDVLYPFRTDSDFFYLSGFTEPEAVLVLVPGREQGEYVLFCREKDPSKEIWDGFRHGQEGAINQFGADDSFPISDIDDILPGLLENKHRVYYTMGLNHDFDQRLMGWVNTLRQKARSGVVVPGEFVALDHLLHDLRLFKSNQEIKWMKKAADISISAHERAMRFCKPKQYEYQLEAEFVHEFYRHGCRDSAYPSIVGGGANGCILHYIDNNQQLKSGSLVLIDAGVEYMGYASDITRTFPVNGKFSKAQKALYEVVLNAQLAAIDKVKPNNHWDEPHLAAVYEITKGLVELGLLEGDVDTLIEEEAYKPFYMHRTGHWLGLDVHDVGDYKVDGHWRVFEPGMVLTVEPGLYIGRNRDVDKKWWDIGIRIEDDLVVTDKGHEILTKKLIKSVDDIEAFMRK